MVKLYKILEFLNINKSSYTDLDINNASSILPGKKNSISFIQQNEKINEKIHKTKSLVILIPKIKKIKNHKNKIIIGLEDPKAKFCEILNLFFEQKKTKLIHKNSIIDSKAKISKNVHIGAFSFVGKSIIEKNVIIHPNVTILDNVIIKENSVIGAGTVIGSEGFCYVKTKDLDLIRFPHIGGVEIGKNVRIGANNCIDKGSLENTVIHDNVKVDNNVHIAHNCTIGNGTIIAAGSTFSGSVNVGKNVWVGTRVTIRDKINIGDNAFIGIGSVVIKDVEANDLVYGIPAKKK